MQESFSGTWMSLGVDAFSEYVIPERLRPGIGLRPGAERPDLEEHVAGPFDALDGPAIALSRRGLGVVVDVGHHDDYSKPMGILGRVALGMADLPAYLIGVRCPVEVVMRRRDAGERGREGRYVGSDASGAVPEPVLLWERAVHDPGIYDLEVDTSVLSARECARAIRARLDDGPPTAFPDLARRSGPG